MVEFPAVSLLHIWIKEKNFLPQRSKSVLDRNSNFHSWYLLFIACPKMTVAPLLGLWHAAWHGGALEELRPLYDRPVCTRGCPHHPSARQEASSVPLLGPPCYTFGQSLPTSAGSRRSRQKVQLHRGGTASDFCWWVIATNSYVKYTISWLT